MAAPLLTIKLYIPPPRPDRVPRPHPIRRLDQSLRPVQGLTLISAPAGFGKTTFINMVTGRSVGNVGDVCTWPGWRPVLPAPGAQAPWPAWRSQDGQVARASGPGDGQVAADGGDQWPLFPAGMLDGLTLGYSSVDERAMSWQ